jgi:hypothetical protein
MERSPKMLVAVSGNAESAILSSRGVFALQRRQGRPAQSAAVRRARIGHMFALIYHSIKS